MNEIQIFENEEFGRIRTLLIDGEPWFIGKDVTEILGYAKARNAVTAHVDEEDRTHALIQGGCSTGLQDTLLINESGLYSLILSSKLPGAKAFKRWVTSEILPTIRRTGGYVNDEELFISTYMPHADDATQQLFRMSLQQIRRLNEKIEHDKPLVDFANYVGKSETLIDMGAMAKLAEKEMENIRIGRNRLFKWLREKGVLMNNNLPYQRYIETGYFQVCDANGGSKEKPLIFPQTMVTGKGQIYLINRLKNEYPEGKSK